ncbi:hypothetical protein HZS_5214 [Henneguya salminicola]|nr:hypothetical protein HZS_5214 [Henneguya salminicola]
MEINTKNTSIRTYDDEGFRLRAGCICYKKCSEKMLVLLVCYHSADKWILPAGGIDPGEPPNVAAERETIEEAGVCGTLGDLLEVLTVSKCLSFQNSTRNTRTHIYSLQVTEIIHEKYWKESIKRLSF